MKGLGELKEKIIVVVVIRVGSFFRTNTYLFLRKIQMEVENGVTQFIHPFSFHLPLAVSVKIQVGLLGFLCFLFLTLALPLFKYIVQMFLLKESKNITNICLIQSSINIFYTLNPTNLTYISLLIWIIHHSE